MGYYVIIVINVLIATLNLINLVLLYILFLNTVLPSLLLIHIEQPKHYYSYNHKSSIHIQNNLNITNYLNFVQFHFHINLIHSLYYHPLLLPFLRRYLMGYYDHTALDFSDLLYQFLYC